MNVPHPAIPHANLIDNDAVRSNVSLPALLLDVDALEHNIATMAARARQAGINLRPHSKGGKCIEIARMQAEAGAIGICCTTLGEAEVMSAAGLPGILITSPATTPNMIARLLAIVARSPDAMIVTDSIDNVEALSSAARTSGATLRVIVEFDVGQGRTGARTVEDAVAVAKAVDKAAGLTFAGLQAYYGHLQHIAGFADRKSAASAQMARIVSVIEALRTASLPPAIVTGGGTGTFDIDCRQGLFTEIQAGSYIFMDREYCEIDLTGDPSRPAYRASLFVAAAVVSRNEPALLIVNAGYKSFATEGGMPLVLEPRLPDPVYRLMGDEHGGISCSDTEGLPRIGDIIQFLTPHCDPTINLYDRYHCFRGGAFVGTWPIAARGK